MSVSEANAPAPDVKPSDGAEEQAATLDNGVLEMPELGEAGEQTESEQPQPEKPAKEPAGDGPSAPESYEAFQAPEGSPFQNDSATIAAFKDVAKSLNLTQEQAQAVIDKVAPAMQQQSQQQLEQLHKQWEQETRSDPVIGGEHLPVTFSKANEALRVFDKGGELTALLNETGLGKNRVVLSRLARIRDAISQDMVLTGNVGEKAPERTAKDHYPKSPNLNP